MNSSLRGYLTVSIAIFALAALMQLVRALAGFAVQVGPYSVPVAASWALALAVGALAVWDTRVLRSG